LHLDREFGLFDSGMNFFLGLAAHDNRVTYWVFSLRLLLRAFLLSITFLFLIVV